MSSISVILRAVSAARGAVSPLCSVFTPLITPAAFFAYLLHPVNAGVRFLFVKAADSSYLELVPTSSPM